MTSAATLRVVDVSDHGRRLSLDRGFLVVCDDDGECGRVALDDIGSVLLSAYGTSCTTPLIEALAERGAVLAVCGRNHLPVAWTVPVAGHHAQTRIMAAQVDAGRPLRKRLWQYIVRTKVLAQSEALRSVGIDGPLLSGLVPLVRSGDATNIEGRAARIYWPALMGTSFVRDREADGPNAVLNYGYTVLRASMARAVVAAGLHPGVSIQHRRDPLALADDLMEPFRPVVDCRVAALLKESRAHVTREVRADLVELLGSVELGVQQLAQQIAAAFVNRAVPNWKEWVRGADVGAVRLTDDDGGAPQGCDPVPERPSGPRLHEASDVGVREDMPWDDGDDDE